MFRDKIHLRYEKPSDYRAVEELTREAFWNRFVPGCTEHYLLHTLRDSDAFIPQLDIVAVIGGTIVGSIVYTKAKILCEDGRQADVLCFGPLSVHPRYQKRGIGSLLVERTKEIAGRMGSKAILIYGDPAYYSRFGFVKAELHGIRTADGMYAAALLANELFPGALYGCKGRFVVDELYSVDEAAAAEFDKDFAPKEKRDDLPSQAQFRALSEMRW